jgi:hypothetical protein
MVEFETFVLIGVLHAPRHLHPDAVHCLACAREHAHHIARTHLPSGTPTCSPLPGCQVLAVVYNVLLQGTSTKYRGLWKQCVNIL